MSSHHFDVLIVGAGLSGIGAACHLKRRCSKKSFAILEGREAMGGTWDLFRYPGIRSDSDMATLGYRFKPWQGEKDIADGESILNYVKEAAEEHQICGHIRYGQMVKQATWSTDDAQWTVEVTVKATGDTTTYTCNMLLMCSGYYSYKSGHTPDFVGRNDFKGTIVHPQKWPDDLDYAGKKVVVIGSGATAVTIVPAIANDTEHVVMLQRSPTYMLIRPEIDPRAAFLRKWLPAKLAYALIRWRNLKLGKMLYQYTRTNPDRVKQFLLGGVRAELGKGYDIKTHFTPRYNPWDQRLCLVPDADLFHAIKSGKASVVTDRIKQFTPTGILLESGDHLDADIIVTATGLSLEVLGGIQVSVDGRSIDFAKTFSYKGMMYSDVPNMITTFGYINAAWTLRADLIAEFACRVINHMGKRNARQCTPRLRDEDRGMPERAWIEDFSSNYLRRVMHLFPKQGDREPWLNPQDYQDDIKRIRRGRLDDGVLAFDNPVSVVANTAKSNQAGDSQVAAG